MRGKVVVRVVTAPRTWYCDECGGEIKAGEKCGKQGSRKICARCIEKSKGGEK